MSVFGVSLPDLLLLTFCFSLPFLLLALIVTFLYRRDRRLTPPEPDAPDAPTRLAPRASRPQRRPNPDAMPARDGDDPSGGR